MPSCNVPVAISNVAQLPNRINGVCQKIEMNWNVQLWIIAMQIGDWRRLCFASVELIVSVCNCRSTCRFIIPSAEFFIVPFLFNAGCEYLFIIIENSVALTRVELIELLLHNGPSQIATTQRFHKDISKLLLIAVNWTKKKRTSSAAFLEMISFIFIYIYGTNQNQSIIFESEQIGEVYCFVAML